MAQTPTDPVIQRSVAEYYGADHLARCETKEIFGCTCGFAEAFKYLPPGR